MKEYKLKENAKKCVASLNRTEAYKFQSSGQTVELSPDFGKFEGIYSFEWLSVPALRVGPSTPWPRWSHGSHEELLFYPVLGLVVALQFPTKRHHVYPGVHRLLAPVPKRRRAPNAGAMAFPNAGARSVFEGCELLHHDQFHPPTCLYKPGPHAQSATIAPPHVKKAKHHSHAHLAPALDPPPQCLTAWRQHGRCLTRRPHVAPRCLCRRYHSSRTSRWTSRMIRTMRPHWRMN